MDQHGLIRRNGKTNILLQALAESLKMLWNICAKSTEQEKLSMNQTETEKLLTILQKLYPNHFKEFDQETFDIQAKMWERSLIDYTYKESLVAVEYWMNTEKFPPVLAEFKELLVRLKKGSNHISAKNAWEVVDLAVRKFGSYGQEKAFETFSEPIKRAVRNIGGWQKIC